MRRRLSAVFVCQKGELEVKAALLAASLRNIYSGDILIHCAIPEIPGMETHPENDTLAFLNSLDIKIHYFNNPVIENESGQIHGLQFSNKIFCYPDELDEGRILFLDSDLICLRKPELLNSLKTDIAVCQAFKSLDLDWKELYIRTGISEPGLRVNSILDGKVGYPYFNTGLFTLDTGLLNLFLDEWEHLFREIRSMLVDPQHLHHSDQISLSLAIQKLKFSYEVLPIEFNYPSGSYIIGKRPFFAHYHNPEKISRDHVLYRYTMELTRKYPSLVEIAKRYRYWRNMISNSKISAVFFLKLKDALRGHYYKSP